MKERWYDLAQHDSRLKGRYAVAKLYGSPFSHTIR